MTETSSLPEVHPTITMLSGDRYTLPPCRSINDIKVQACLLFPANHPPQVRMFDEKAVLLEENEYPAAFSSVVFCDGDRSDQEFWKEAVRAYAKFGDNERAGLAMPET